MATITVNRILQQSSETVTNQESNVNTGYLDVGPETVVNGAPKTLVAVIDVSKLSLAYISTTVDDVTFNFDGTTPTLTIKAGIPYLWTTDCNMVNALSDDFTQVVVTNPNADVDAEVRMWFAYDAD